MENSGRKTAQVEMFTLSFSVLKICLLLASATSMATLAAAIPMRERRIVNGEELSAHSWPWLASLHFYGPQHVYQEQQGLPHLCGGVLVAPQWVLSASHCFMSELGAGLNESSNWRVMLGEHDRRTNESTEQNIPVERIFKHPNITWSPFGGDVALLKLAFPATINASVRPVEMESNPNLPPGTGCKVAGWGQLQDAGEDMSLVGRGSIVPMVVQLHRVDTASCAAAYVDAPHAVRVDESVLCFGSNQGRDSCQGDSGTPLICWPEPGRPVVTGILSLGFGCGLSSHPGIYSSVAHYRADILDTMEAFQN